MKDEIDDLDWRKFPKGQEAKILTGFQNSATTANTKSASAMGATRARR